MTRPIGLWLVTLFSLAACAAEQPLTPLAMGTGSPARALAIGDEILLATASDLPQDRPLTLVVAGPSQFYGDHLCPGTQEIRAVFLGSGVSTTMYTNQALAAGTRLRFVEFRAFCDGAYHVYAFQVVRGQGD